MKSELAAKSRDAESSAPAVDAAKLGAEALPSISEAFDPFLFSDRPPESRDPGDRHAAWTLVVTLRDRFRDLNAVATDPLRVTIVGADLGWLAPQLLAWGAERVTVADHDAAELTRVAAIGEALGIDRGALLLADEPGAAGDADVVIADEREDGSGVAPEQLAALARHTFVLSDKKAETRAELRHVGMAVAIATPPLDADHRFINTELVLLVASKPAAEGERPA
jgi:hypothetical protein